MSELRDARFKKALETAPDADVRPAPAVSQAIRAAARHALPVPVAPSAPQAWWQRLWQSTGSPRAPWSAAFASLLLAVLVTVMWVHEPIPDARPMPPATRSEPAPAAPIASTATGMATPAPAPASKNAAHSADASALVVPPSTRLAKSAPAAQAGSALEVPAAQADKRVTGEVAAPVTTVVESAAAPATESAQPTAADQKRARSKAYTALATEEAARAANLQKDQSAETSVPVLRSDTPTAASPLAAAPIVAAPKAAPPLSTAPPAPPALVAAASPPPFPEPPPGPGRLDGLEAWTTLLVELEGRTVTLNGVSGQRLFAAAIQRLALRAKPLPDPLSAVPHSVPKLRLRILSQGQTLAVMHLWDRTALWRRPGQVDVWTDMTASDMSTMLRLAQQALASADPE